MGNPFVVVDEVRQFTQPAETKPATAVDQLADYVLRLRQVTQRIKELNTEADAIKAVICDALGDAEVGTVHGLPVVSWSKHVRHSLDQKALREAQPQVYSAFLKATTVRRFTLNEEADQ